MSSDLEYQKVIKTYNWNDLDDLWAGILRRNTPNWDAGKALEYLILRAFEIDGAEVRWPYSVRIRGEEIEQIDGAIYVSGMSCLTECKDYNESDGKKKSINFEPIAKMRNQLMRRPSSTIGSIFCSGEFTEPALILANFISPQTILLWNGQEVTYCLKRHIFCKSLTTKYRKCVEFGAHDYDTSIEEET